MSEDTPVLRRRSTASASNQSESDPRPEERDPRANVGVVEGRADREVDLLVTLQKAISRPATIKAARGLSYFGEHSIGWFGAGLLGAVVDRRKRRQWLVASVGVVAAHGASIGVKRVVRRPRPMDERVAVHVGTPSRLSFPSSHATSTTAAAVLFSGLTGRNMVPALVPPMLVSRLVLGVHYPTDVLAGAALGGAVAAALRRATKARAAKE